MPALAPLPNSSVGFARGSFSRQISQLAVAPLEAASPPPWPAATPRERDPPPGVPTFAGGGRDEGCVRAARSSGARRRTPPVGRPEFRFPHRLGRSGAVAGAGEIEREGETVSETVKEGERDKVRIFLF